MIVNDAKKLPHSGAARLIFGKIAFEVFSESLRGGLYPLLNAVGFLLALGGDR